MRTRRIIAALLVLVACSSDDSATDSGSDAPIADGTAKDASPKADATIQDASIDTTVGDADTGVDATISDATLDSTVADAGTDATILDATISDAMIDSACSDAASLDATFTTLASALGGAFFVAVDGTNVYWTSGTGFGSVLKCAIGGCNGTPTTIASGFVSPSPFGIAVDGTDVYWTMIGAPDAGAGAVMTCPVGGCDGGVPTTLASGLQQPWSIAIDGTNVYWTDINAGTVMSCAKTGCNGSPTTLASAPGGTLGIAVDSVDIYWTWGAGGNVGGLMKCPLSGCADGSAATYLFNGNGPGFIALDNDNVYAAGGAVAKFAKDGGGFLLLAQGYNAFDVATDGVNVYWTDDTNYGNNVRRCSVNGCCGTPTPIAPTQNQPWGIAVDGTNVYWVTEMGGTTMQRTPK